MTSTAIAGPLNLPDPTPRQIRVEVDQELHDYAESGGAYSLPVAASFTSDGTTATITVDGSAAAAFVTDFFNGAVGTVPGSFSDYVITIDVASGAVTSAHDQRVDRAQGIAAHRPIGSPRRRTERLVLRQEPR